MDRDKLIQTATSPSQYDSLDISWESEQGLQSPMRAFFWKYISDYQKDWTGKDVLDIGAGTGWLLELARNLGARSVVGIEPSTKNIQLGKETNPHIKLLATTFENFKSEVTYDVIILCMSISHMRDLDMVFAKLALLLKETGKVIMIVPDFEYFKVLRPNDTGKIERLSDDEIVVSKVRSVGTIVDIARTHEMYIKTARKNGLKSLKNLPMLPSEELVSAMPKYKEVESQPVTQFFVFNKT